MKLSDLSNRQLGNSYCNDYDEVLERLQCMKLDEFNGITAQFSLSSSESPILACKFANKTNYEHYLALANENGHIAVQNINTPRESLSLNLQGQLNGTVAHCNAIFDLAWKFGDMKFVTASGDQTCNLWDIGTGSDIRLERVFSSHERSVKTVAFRKNDAFVFASGSRDGMILTWDTRENQHVQITVKPDNIINSQGTNTPSRKTSKKLPIGSLNNSITGLVFQDENSLISCNAGTKSISIWDLRKSYTNYKRVPLPKFQIQSKQATGFNNLLIDGNKLYASSMNNQVLCYNIATYLEDPVMLYNGHMNNSFYIRMCLSPDGKYLFSGSGDEKAYIWNVKYPTPLLILNGHSAEVTCVAWCQKTNEPVLVTCSDDFKYKIWRIGNEKPPIDDISGRIEKLKNNCDYSEIKSKMKNNNKRTAEDLINLEKIRTIQPGIAKKVIVQNPNKRQRESEEISFNQLENKKIRLEPSIIEKRKANFENDDFRSKLIKLDNNNDKNTIESKLTNIFELEKFESTEYLTEMHELRTPEKNKFLEKIKLNENNVKIPNATTKENLLEILNRSEIENKTNMKENEIENKTDRKTNYEKQTSRKRIQFTDDKMSIKFSKSEIEDKVRQSYLGILNENEMDDIMCQNSLGMPNTMRESYLRNSNKNEMMNDDRLIEKLKSQKRIQLENDEITNISEQISNLPNFVENGEAPHLYYPSPPKKTRLDKDWLTRLRIEKQLKQRMKQLSSMNCATSPLSSMVNKDDENYFLKSDTLNSYFEPEQKLNSTQNSSLLRYFKVTQKQRRDKDN